MISKAKRKEIEDVILKTFSLLDKTNLNTEKYVKLFKSMSDDQFETYIKSFTKNSDNNFQLEVLPNKNEPKLDDIKKAAEFLKVPLEEYIFYRHETNKEGKPIRSMYKCPVGYIHTRRQQQILNKKNSFTTNIDKRNALTNQVTGDSKISRNSDMETYALINMGATNTVKELLGFRADNKTKKLIAYNIISRDGFLKQDDIDYQKRPEDNVSLNSVDIFLTAAGIVTDLQNERGVLLGSSLDME